MIRNYFLTAYRNLIRRNGYAAINISGLAISIAACLLLFLVVRYELSYDRFRPDYEKIYHIYCRDKYSDGVSYNPGIPFPALEALRLDFPAVKFGALYSAFGSQVTLEGSKSQKFIEETGIFFADPEFFDVFKHTWLAGDARLLSEPNTIVLSRRLADKYFQDWKNAVGKTLILDNATTFRVAGVIEDSPANSDFRISAAGSYATLKNSTHYYYSPQWGATTSNFQVYMRLPDDLSEADMQNRLLIFSKKNYHNKSANERTNQMRPLKEVHYDAEIGNMGTHIMSRSTLATLSLIGFLIIIMACINFINLSTAQAVGRSKEVGVRKVLGSNRRQLFWQMLGETKIVVLVSFLFALVLAWIALPYIKHVALIDEDLSLFNAQSLVFFICILVVVTLLAGIYPAMVLSGFRPVVALKNKISAATVGCISLRRGLVVIQFAISQVLIIGTIVAVTQMDYIRHADLGFNKDAILLLQGNSDSTILSKQPAFKEQLLHIPGVRAVSFASDMPSSDNNSGTNFAFDHKPDEDFTLYLKFADEDYFKTFGLQFIAGKGYSRADTSTDVVINETLLKKLRIPSAAQAIGRTIRTGGSRWRTICGVVRDFKTNSLREEVKPIMIASRRKSYVLTCIKLHASSLAHTQNQIRQSWEKFFPDYVYMSGFMEENIERFYQQETQMALLYKIFAGLAVFISCLGLYGLVSFMVVQKTKEVGIRKVLGAGIGNIVFLFSREFTLLVVIAFAVATPVSWYFMNTWLDNFAFRINIGPGVFSVAVIISLSIAWLAVGYKAMQAAVANPVKSLRTE